MAKEIGDPGKIYLVKPLEVFKNELFSRLEQGLEIGVLIDEAEDDASLKLCAEKLYAWQDYNLELIKHSFTREQDDYYLEYKRLHGEKGLVDWSSRVGQNPFDRIKKYIQAYASSDFDYLIRLQNKINLIPIQINSIQIPSAPNKKNKKHLTRKAFIIHGHNNETKLEVARFLEKELKIKALILHEEASLGKTIIEKIEGNSDVDFAVALWTADDEGKSKREKALRDRARQNVVYETGLFVGKLGRNKVIILTDINVEIPSDLLGVVHISINGEWKHELRKEIDAIHKT